MTEENKTNQTNGKGYTVPPEYQGHYQRSRSDPRDWSNGRGPGSDQGPKAWEEREFIETCYRHFNALAVTYKRQLEKLDGREE